MERIKIENLPKVEEDKKIHLKRYVRFINSRPIRKLYQKGFHTHHVYPKSLAEKDNIDDFNGKWNLIELTPREHFIAHLILWKCGYVGMSYAFKYMCDNITFRYKKLNARQYEILRNDFISNMSEDFKHKIWINNKIEEHFVNENLVLPDGYKLGRLSGGFWIHNNIEERWLSDGSSIPIGFEKGRLLSTTKDTKWYTNGKERKMISESDIVPKDFILGRSIDGEVKEKYKMITNGKENKYLYDGELLEEGWYFGQTLNIKKVTWINNGLKNIRWDSTTEMPLGFQLGRMVKGFFIKNENECKMIPFGTEVPKGWIKGRIQYSKKS